MNLERRIEKLETAGNKENLGNVWKNQGETAEEAERRYLRENPGHKGEVVVIGWQESVVV